MDNELMLISLRDREDPEVEKMFIQLEKIIVYYIDS